MQGETFEIFHYYDSYVKEVKLHHHDFYEVYLLNSGRVVYTVEGRTYNLVEEDLLLIAPSELHQLIVPDDTPYERVVLWLSKSFLEELSSSQTNLKSIFERTKSEGNLIKTSKVKQQKIKDLLEEIATLKNSFSFGDDLLCRSKITELLIFLSGELREEKLSAYSSGLENILNFISDNLSDENLTISTIAEANFLSESRLSHLFKEKLGTSIYQYIIKKRLILAKEYLEKGESVINMYNLCGFSDYVSFFRTFKREYGITPKEYFYMMKG